METLCVLVVLVVAVAASPDCSSYCDKLYPGWKVDRRSGCNCDAQQKELRDELKYEHVLKFILLPAILPSEIKHHTIKRSLRVGAVPVEKAQNSRITSKSPDDVLNNSQINEKNLSDCIDLLISISIRRNKNKSLANLENNLKNNNNLNNLEINTKIKNKCDQASAIMHKSVEEIKEHQKNISKKKNQNVDVIPKIDMRSAFELNDEKTTATSTNDDKLVNNTVKSTPNDNPYTKAITTNDNTTTLESAVKKKKLSKTSKNNIQKNTNKGYNLKNFNSVVVNMKDDDNTTNLNVNTKLTKLKNIQTTTGNMSSLSYNLKNLEKNKLNYELTSKKSQSPMTFSERVQNNSMLMTDYNTTNLNVNTKSTKLKNMQTTTGNMSSLSYNLKNLEKNKLNYELTSKKSQSPLTFSKRVQNNSMLMADHSDNVKESTSISNQYTTNSNKTVVLKINQNENNSSLRDKYKENEVPIVNIITREYPNNTISSFLNGTETLTYSKFEEEAIINNNKTENTSDSRLLKSIESELEIRSGSDHTTPSTSEKQSSEIMSPNINGRLFFEYEQEHIPGQFVQTSDGRLQLSLDMNTICDELSQTGKQNSLLISNLCQYLNKKYQSMGYGM